MKESTGGADARMRRQESEVRDDGIFLGFFFWVFWQASNIY